MTQPAIACPFHAAPGADPAVFVGREKALSRVRSRIVKAVASGQPASAPMILTGGEGMGKTVTLRQLRWMAEREGMVAAEVGFTRSAASDNIDALGQAVGRTLGSGLPHDHSHGGSLGQVLLTAARHHLEHGRPGMAVFVDDLGAGSPDELNVLAQVAQQVIGDGATPFVLVAAGRPDTGRRIVDSGATYAERFLYLPLDALAQEEARRLLAETADQAGVSWDHDALETALGWAKGSPSRLQELGAAVWEAATRDGSSTPAGRAIDRAMVERARTTLDR